MSLTCAAQVKDIHQTPLFSPAWLKLRVADIQKIDFPQCMKRRILCGIFLILGAPALPADEPGFSRQLAPADFAAAGLPKLTPAELAKLDQLVRDQGSAAAAAQAAAEAKATQAESEAAAARAAQADAEKRAQGFLAKTRALLLPGGVAEYQAIDSRIVGTLRGWKPGTVFRLENGQRWRVEISADEYDGDTVTNPKARIVPAPISGFKIEIEGFPAVRVRLLGQ